MLTALVALVGLFVALYLALYKAGVIGTLACGTGGCETVQLSRWATFLGVPVATWGVAYYAFVFGLAFAATTERWGSSRGLDFTLWLLTGWGVLFSAWLTYLEVFVIHAVCRFCVVSAIVAIALFALTHLERNSRKSSPASAGP
jgi:uncharacterized membrane protein